MDPVQGTAESRKSLFPIIGLLLFVAGVAVGQAWNDRASRADEPRLLVPAPPPHKAKSESEISAEQIEGFKEWYYAHQPTTFSSTTWRGVNVFKVPMDAWIYQEIIHENPPDVLIETGTNRGGGAYFFASLFDLEKRGRVLTVDIKDYPEKPRHARIRYVLGSSTSPEVLQTFKNSIRPGERVMVALDSDHHKGHVLKELQLYSSLVTVGNYLVVEDSIKNPNYPGAMEAIEEFLKTNSNYVADKDREKFGFTANPNGWLKRVRSAGISFLASRRLRGYTCLPPVWPSAHNIFPQMVLLAPFRPSGVLKTNALPASGSVFSDTAACRGSLRINFSAAKAELPRGHWQPSNPPHHRRKQPPCQMALRQQ